MERLIISFFHYSIGLFQKQLDSISSNNINTFQEGEWFQLRLHYGPFNASYATLSLERDTIKGKPVFHAKGFGETTGIARWFFKVEDYYESYFDEKLFIHINLSAILMKVVTQKTSKLNSITKMELLW